MNDNFDPSYKVKTISEVPKSLSGMSTFSGNRFFDNSMLDAFRVCPRKFYFRNIRHWDNDKIKSALIFGTCWHAAMDFLWRNPKASAEDAFLIFKKNWDQSALKDAEHFDLFPRTPGRAFEMLQEYVSRYGKWLQSIEIIAVEKPFIVPLSEEDQNLFYVGKWDKLYRDGRYIYIADHKTTNSFATTWLNSWSPNGQVDGYLYAGNLEYGSDFKGVMIDGALVQKTKVDFLRVPVERQADQLDAWRWEVLDYVEQIKYYENSLIANRQDQRTNYMAAFPKCTTSCTSYYGMCPYVDICKFISNPDLHDVIDGFLVSPWYPFQIDESPTGEFTVTELQHT